MPKRRPFDADTLLGRTLRLAERDIYAMEGRARRRYRKTMQPGEEDMLEADRKAIVQLGDWLRKVASDTKPPDLSKLSDEELKRLEARLNPKTKEPVQ